MAMMFGRFEVQSELSKSETALIYKVLDTKTGHVVALKTQSLAPLGSRADAFVDTLIAEGESTRDLVGQNIALLYGAGEIDGQFCAAMEYIQGNSVASMLSRKEGFSIWDLLDITRQVCAGLGLAAAKNLIHCSLEPAKIMVQWDGTVKILGYGISNMSLIEAESGKNLGRLMPYCSPEQIRGEAIDLRSNLFTLGAILYEMAAGRKAFDAADPVALVNQIENEMPPEPSSVNSRIQAGVSEAIMKALAKDPAERFQSAREMLEDLEICKENGKKPVVYPATEAAKLAPIPPVAVNSAARAATVPAVSAGPASAAARMARVHAVAAENGSSAGTFGTGSALGSAAAAAATSDGKPDLKSGGRGMGEFDVSAPEYQAARVAVLSTPAPAPTVERRESTRSSPTVAIDPIMAPRAPGSPAKLFSELAEMPPLKPVVTASPSAESAPTLEAQFSPGKYPGKGAGTDDTRRNQAAEVAEKPLYQKVMHQIATIPPRLMLYALLAAVGLILLIVLALYWHVRSEDDGSTAAARPAKVAESDAGANMSLPALSTPPVIPPSQKPVIAILETQPNLQIRQTKKAVAKKIGRAPAPVPAPVVIPGEALIDSSPQGAQFQVDEKSDPSWVTPFTLTGLTPGKHTVAVTKSGYSSEIRSVEITAGNRSSLVLHLSAISASLVVNSTPAGAEIILDGKPTRQTTPAQLAVEKGKHTVLLRKAGYLDETVTANLAPAQNLQYSPSLRALGNTTDMRIVGKLRKLFGRGESTAGMGSIGVHTQPKGAQVAINQRVLEKTAPVDVMLGPGNYIVDITLTGFKPIRRVVTVEKGGKLAVDEILERQ